MDIFLISDSVNADTLVDTISRQFPAKTDAPWQARRTYYDTYNWALYNNGLYLFRSSQGFFLCSLQDDVVLQTIPGDSGMPPDLFEALSDHAAGEKLKQILAIRPLLPRGTLQARTQTIHVLDRLEKAVLHVRLERMRAGRKPPVNLVILKPVRGYRTHYRRLSLLLGGIGRQYEAPDAFRLMLGAAGAAPGDYSPTVRVPLYPDMTAQQSTVIILKRLLEIMRQNAPGITADIDTECVHDFRVAVRRTRSALKQIKRVFPDDVTRSFRKRFSGLAGASNTLRDLDVYLLNRRRYEKMLPAGFRPDIAVLFEALRTDRDQQHREFVAALKSRSCRSLLKDWEAFLNEPAGQSGERPEYAGAPVMQIARKYIFKQYNRVMVLGGRVDDSTPDTDLHTLRIQCKNLRYLLEFFASLFPQVKVSALMANLKGLQDNLGEYNDLSLQQLQLRSFLPRVTASQHDRTGTAVAVGGLIAALYRHQQDVRRAFAQTFRAFSGTESADMYRELFG